MSFRLDKILASISEKYVLNPIIVNEKMEIIDGQGRFEALKKLGKPIHYIIAYGATAKDCWRMNRFNTIWTKLDFCQSYAKAGLEAYVLLLKTAKKAAIDISRAAMYGGHGINGGEATEMFQRGKFSFSQEDAERAIDIAKKASEIKQALLFNGRTNNAFHTAIKVSTQYEGYDHEKMIRNCKILRSSYMQAATIEAELKEFERIYNYRQKPENKLYFSDYMRNKGHNVRSYDTTTRYDQSKDNNVSTLKED